MKISFLQRKKTALAVLFVLLLSVAGMTNALAQTFTVGNLNYSINDDGASVTLTGHVNGSAATGELVIPESVEYYGTSYSVTAIGNDAFYYCSRLSGSLVIPNSVTTIGVRAFSDCYGFNGSLTIPVSVSRIGQFAFRSCGFTTLNYNPINCGWQSWYSGNVGWFENCYALDTLNLGDSVESIPSEFFNGFSSFTGDLIIPESVTRIYQDAFKDCSGITVLSLPNSLISIGNSAFYNCSGLSGSLIIPDNVTSIGEQTFANCTGFSGTMTIGSSVTQIGNSAFFNACAGFTSFDVKPETPPTLGNNVFVSVDYGIPVQVPCGTLNAYQNASGWSSFTNIQETNPCIWEITATANPAIGGTISGIGTYEQGQTCTMTATPLGIFEFSRWTENNVVVSTNATYSFTVEGNRDLVAHFTNPNYIVFADPNVEARCVELWDSDSDGYMSYAEAAAVTDLGNAFENWSITSFNELQYFTGLTYLNNYEFYACQNLTSIIIPASVTTIGYYAFRYCYSLTSITIPESVTSINNRAFGNCNSLTTLNYNATNCSLNDWLNGVSLANIVIGDNVQVIPENFIQGQSNLVGALNIPTSVTSIGGSAFANCTGFTGALNLPASLISIGGSAFENCTGFTGTLTIPESVTSVGAKAFANTRFTTVLYNAINCATMGGEGYDENWNWVWLSPFMNCQALTTLNIGNNVQTVPYRAFLDLSTLTGSLSLPASVTSIGELAFANCTGLTGTLTLSASLTSIGSTAFANCTGLTGDLVIPNTVTSIGKAAFANCTGFTSLTIGTGVEIIGSSNNWYHYLSENPFYNCSGITTLNFNAFDCYYIPIEWYNDNGHSPFAYLSSLTTLNIGESVQKLPPFAFDGCSGLTGTLNIPNSVTEIGPEAFRNCSGLTGALSIPSSVTSIGGGAFDGCIGLGGTLTIGSNVTYVGPRSFAYTGIETVNFNATRCESIGNYYHINPTPTYHSSLYRDGYAFEGCENLTTLNIGNGVEWIPSCAFTSCTSLSGALNLPNSVTRIEDAAYEGCTGLSGSLQIPDAVTFIGFSAFANCPRLDGTVTLGENVQCVAGNAFANTNFTTMNYNAINCWVGYIGEYDGEHYYQSISLPSSLTTLNFGDNVQSISQIAFKDCSSLTGTLTLPNSLTFIGDQAFYNCYGFESIVMGNSVETIGSEAFRNCGGLRGELTLPETLQSVGTYAFASCDELTTINYNAINCTEMGNAQSPVFYDCASIQHINIGENVESIPNYAFKRCSTVIDMNVAAVVPPTIEASTFGTVSRAIPVNVPFGSGDDYRSAQYWEEFFNITEGIGQNNYTNHWHANSSQFPFNMTAIGIIQIDGVEQSTEALEIGAFCGNECRGSQLLTFYPQLNRYLVFLTLCGEAGDMLFFRLYNHELGEESVLGCASVLTFEDNGMLGSVEDPYAFNFTHIQNTAINEGWTWYSTFVELNGLNGIEMMTQGLGENGVMIKSQYQGFLTYDGGMWMGNLNSINNESMYLINTSANTVLSMAGNYAVPAQHALTLNPGWNWIGYTMASAADVNMALGNLNATNGDIVKAHNGFASYVNGMGWLGSLNTFTPGEGFMYHSNKNTNVTFTYSEGAKGGELRQNITAEGNHYVPKMNAYPFNMSMMAVVEIEGTEVHDGAFEMAAFAGNECRGSVRLMDVEALNRYMAFLTIAGDETTTLSFRLLDLETGMTYYSDQSIVFEADAIVGDPMEPFTLRFMPAVTNCGESALAYDVYPNPVKAGEWVSLNGHSSLTSKVRVEVVNAMGVVVSVETLNSQPATLKTPAVPGVYMMRVITEGKGSQVYKLIVE